MNHKLKYLKLFEGLTHKEIPYSKIDKEGKLNINLPKRVNRLPPEYDQLTDEITGNLLIRDNPHITKIIEFDNLISVGGYVFIYSNQSLTSITGFNKLKEINHDLHIEYNKSLTEITGFNNLTSIGWCLFIISNESLTEITGFNNLANIDLSLSIKYNQALTEITGFNNVTSIGWCLHIRFNQSLTEITGFNGLISISNNLYITNNPKLVAISIPGNLVKAVNYNEGYGINYDDDLKFKSPGDFINSPVIYQDLVTRFNPGDHGHQVIQQIVENIEEWGTEETKIKVYSFLGKYLTPEQLKLAPDRIKHRYNPAYQGTTGRDVVKINSGEVYGMF